MAKKTKVAKVARAAGAGALRGATAVRAMPDDDQSHHGHMVATAAQRIEGGSGEGDIISELARMQSSMNERDQGSDSMAGCDELGRDAWHRGR